MTTLAPESVATPAPENAPAVGDPRWWLLKLTKRLLERRPTVRKFEDYYAGKHNLEYATEKFRKTFGNLFKELADNWCEVIVDATEERLNVEGFRFGDSPDADKDAWAMWQKNNLDGDSQLAHLDMLVTGFAYALVWNRDNNPAGDALITVESPLECIVAHSAGSRREREAGLKQWKGDDGKLYSIVYLSDALYKFRTQAPVDTIDDSSYVMDGQGTSPSFWEVWDDGGDGGIIVHPLGEVPLVPFYNRPRTTRPGGVSELHIAVPLQNAVNKLLSDLLLGSEFGAFRQRWATGLTLDRDEEGNTKPPPFKHGPGNLWIDEGSDIPGSTGAQFGEFGELTLTNVIAAIDMCVAHLASQSRTPPHYLNTSADRLSGESIKSAETGLVAKCKRKFRPTGEGWEEVERLGFAVQGDTAKAEEYAAETIWADPESRTEAEHVDAVLKKQSLGVPKAQLWEDLGYTPQQIARFEAMIAREQMTAALNPPPAPVLVTTATGANGNGPPAAGGGNPPAPAPAPAPGQ